LLSGENRVILSVDSELKAPDLRAQIRDDGGKVESPVSVRDLIPDGRA